MKTLANRPRNKSTDPTRLATRQPNRFSSIPACGPGKDLIDKGSDRYVHGKDVIDNYSDTYGHGIDLIDKNSGIYCH